MQSERTSSTTCSGGRFSGGSKVCRILGIGPAALACCFPSLDLARHHRRHRSVQEDCSCPRSRNLRSTAPARKRAAPTPKGGA
ncbi:hypothetical protein ABID21_003577 [Pseudorhizobium tarimense]|uniref:Uncharacterized protein n=1 Tax=Pseudorhizobium tarimense TaxID=1079109 RepID=A0ABV2HB74_9HYPH